MGPKGTTLSRKDQRIEELEELYAVLEREYDGLSRDYLRKCNETPKRAPQIPTTRKKEYAGDFCFDFWPLTDWIRFGVQSKWQPGRYFQFVAGPIRIEFFEA